MPRKRPVILRTDKTLHSAVRKRWRRWLPALNRDLSDLLGKREIFWELQDVVKENQYVLQHGAFFEWMCTNYISTVTMMVRGVVDLRPDVQSLGRMLYEIMEHPGVINRSSHKALYRKAPRLPSLDLGDLTFNNLVGKGRDVLSQSDVEKDLRSIEDASKRVILFTHKRVAHRAAQGELRRLPSFTELDTAMDAIDRVFCKYNCLLTASGMSSTFATRQYNWKEALFEPWIKPGSKFSPVA